VPVAAVGAEEGVSGKGHAAGVVRCLTRNSPPMNRTVSTNPTRALKDLLTLVKWPPRNSPRRFSISSRLQSREIVAPASPMGFEAAGLAGPLPWTGFGPGGWTAFSVWIGGTAGAGDEGLGGGDEEWGG